MCVHTYTRTAKHYSSLFAFSCYPEVAVHTNNMTKTHWYNNNELRYQTRAGLGYRAAS